MLFWRDLYYRQNVFPSCVYSIWENPREQPNTTAQRSPDSQRLLVAPESSITPVWKYSGCFFKSTRGEDGHTVSSLFGLLLCVLIIYTWCYSLISPWIHKAPHAFVLTPGINKHTVELRKCLLGITGESRIWWCFNLPDDFFSFKCVQTAQTGTWPGRRLITLWAGKVPDVIRLIPFKLQRLKTQKCAVYLFFDYDFLIFFCCFSLSTILFSQVAQWPEKEEEEQPVFGEECDWWVTEGMGIKNQIIETVGVVHFAL